MAKTVLDAVNEILKKTSALDSGSTLTTLTDTARQTYIDIAIQSLNEVVDEIYSVNRWTKPKSLKRGTITLVEGQREYSLRSDMLRLRPEYKLINESASHTIEIMGEDGYQQIILSDLEQDDTGRPSFCAISPINGRLVMDRLPNAADAGLVYKYHYEKEFSLDEAEDTVPFNDAAFRGVVAAAAEMWKLHRHQEMSADLFRISLGRACRFAKQYPPRHSWMPASRAGNSTDPMQK